MLRNAYEELELKKLKLSYIYHSTELSNSYKSSVHSKRKSSTKGKNLETRFFSEHARGSKLIFYGSTMCSPLLFDLLIMIYH